jgi:ATP-dependent Clp protease protease subunit
LSKHSSKPKEDIAKDIERDKILTATEAVEYGLIDQILASRKATSKK